MQITVLRITASHLLLSPPRAASSGEQRPYKRVTALSQAAGGTSFDAVAASSSERGVTVCVMLGDTCDVGVMCVR